MDLTYGQGKFIEKDNVYAGNIILSEHKLFLKKANEDLPQTYVPLEKIEAVTLKNNAAYFFVRQSLHFQYTTCFQGDSKNIKELVSEIVSRRGFKKKFLQNKWVET